MFAPDAVAFRIRIVFPLYLKNVVSDGWVFAALFVNAACF